MECDLCLKTRNESLQESLSNELRGDVGLLVLQAREGKEDNKNESPLSLRRMSAGWGNEAIDHAIGIDEQ